MSYDDLTDVIILEGKFYHKFGQSFQDMYRSYRLFVLNENNLKGYYARFDSHPKEKDGYINFLLSIKEFETWEDVKTFYAI